VVNFADGRADAEQAARGRGEQIDQPTEESEPQVRPGQDRGGAIIGQVKQVDENQIIVTDQQVGRPRTFRFAEDCQVFIDGKPGEIDSLRPGMRVRVMADKEKQNVVRRLEAFPSKQAPNRDLDREAPPAPPR
jgi:hypothetical protein